MLMIEAPPVPIREYNNTLLVGNSRVPIDTVIRYFDWGNTPEEIVLQFPALKLRDVYGVINYYLNNREVIEPYLAVRQAQSEAIRDTNEALFPAKGIRERLLARLKNHA